MSPEELIFLRAFVFAGVFLAIVVAGTLALLAGYAVGTVLFHRRKPREDQAHTVVRRMEELLAKEGLDSCEVSAEWVLRLTTCGSALTEEDRRKVYGAEWNLLREFDVPLSLHVRDDSDDEE